LFPNAAMPFMRSVPLAYRFPFYSSFLTFQACFTAVYGPPPSQQGRAAPRKSNLGVCGVCRRPMKIGDGDSGKSNSSSFPYLHPLTSYSSCSH
jgi:hypothetical protein